MQFILLCLDQYPIFEDSKLLLFNAIFQKALPLYQDYAFFVSSDFQGTFTIYRIDLS